ncbi:MAG TPA: hypothetical protein VG939_11915, partial [Caulobacteraceae bacterium]|nr:hypothetical protein [Caulobacteraceae bacterium]
MALALAACGGHPSAVPARAPDGSAASASAGSPAPAAQASAAPAPVRQVNGKPFWAANKKHS